MAACPSWLTTGGVTWATPGVAAIALSVTLFFSLGGPLVRRLGPSAVGAINKIFGFLILAIAVQLVWNGLADFRN